MSGRLFDPPVRYLITPGFLTRSNFESEKDILLETIRLSVSERIDLVQLREKSLPARQLFDLAVKAADIVRDSETRLLINERFDIAVAARADGVHLTSTSIAVAKVRLSVPEGLLIGVSAHSGTEVETAQNQGADFAMLGPVFSTPGKGEPLGLSKMRSVCSSVAPFPVIGIGGIDSSNAESVIDAGAAGFAAIRYLNDFVRMAR